MMAAPETVEEPQPSRSRALLGSRTMLYAIAAIGPISASGAHFILSILMLRLLSSAEFGSFSFLLTASQLSWGIWGALICVPIPVFLGRPSERAAGEATMLAMNLLGASVSVPAFAAMATLLNLHTTAVISFAIYNALTLVRLVARTFAYVQGQPLRATASDIIYSVGVLAILALGLLVLGWEAHTACYVALLAGAALGILPFGLRYAQKQLAPFGWSELRRYGAIWREQSRWALVGVLTTEMTGNAHVYLITALQGPNAFAPVAASSLLVRPISVAQSAIADFEKPQMARLINAGDWPGLISAKRFFTGVLLTVWALTCCGAWMLFQINPRIVFSEAYDLHFQAIATALWLVVALFRVLQVPPSTMLGAAGRFKVLAFASIWSSVASLLITGLLIVFTGTLWSILGLAIGASLFLFWTERFCKEWLRQLDTCND